MTTFAHINLRDDVEDRARPMGWTGSRRGSRRARSRPMASGLSLQRIAPGVRQPFAHRHASREEVYVVVEGGGRVKVGDRIEDLALRDAIRIPGPLWRCVEGGPDGLTFVVFGARPMGTPAPSRSWSAAGGATDPVAPAARYDPPSFVVDGGEQSARGVRSAVAG